MLQAFDAVLPGSAERLMVLAEKEAEHRHQMDRWFGQYRFAGLGIAALIAIAGLGLCGYLVYKNQTGYALGAFLGEVATLAGVFALGRFLRPTTGA
jgi:uncharacterized membrane protein